MRFRTKTILGVALIQALLLPLVVMSALHNLRQANEEELEQQVQLAGRLIAASARDAVISEDLATLDGIVAEVMAAHQFDYLRILDSSGRTLAAAGHPPAGPFHTDQRVAEVTDGSLDWEEAINVAGLPYGRLQLGLSTRRLEQALAEAWRWALGLLAMEMGLVALFSWLLGSHLVRQLIALRDASLRFASGELDHRVAELGNDELAETARAFNTMARQLGESHRQLSSEVSQRQEAQEALARANADLRRFAEISAHHLQEPTRRLTSFAQRLHSRLAGRLEDEEANLSLEFIVQGANRLRALVRDVQLYLAASEPRGEPASLNPDGVVQGVLERLAPQIRSSGAQIDLASLPPLPIDPPRLTDLLLALFDNALRYRQPERPLRIALSVGEGGAGRLQLQLCDNGHGIPAEYRERVFRVFERLQPGGPDAGTGLGLALARRIVESCGGSIHLTESSGGGTTVVIDLPNRTHT